MNQFMPRNYKYKKIHKKVYVNKLTNYRVNTLKKNSYGLKILENGVLSAKVLDVIHKYIKKRIKKVGTLKFNVFPHIPVTRKSSGIRMGKGVGNIDKWVVPMKKGLILVELNDISINMAKIILKSVSYKLPVKSKFVVNLK